MACSCVDFMGGENLAVGAEVDSPDGLEQDFCTAEHRRVGCNDAWAVDGDLDTYWDEDDGAAEYRLRIRLADANADAAVGGLELSGWRHLSHSPRSFSLVCDGHTVLRVRDALYRDNVFTACFPPVRCATAELRIDTAYGSSPAVRELRLLAALQNCSQQTVHRPAHSNERQPWDPARLLQRLSSLTSASCRHCTHTAIARCTGLAVHSRRVRCSRERDAQNGTRRH